MFPWLWRSSLRHELLPLYHALPPLEGLLERWEAPKMRSLPSVAILGDLDEPERAYGTRQTAQAPQLALAHGQHPQAMRQAFQAADRSTADIELLEGPRQHGQLPDPRAGDVEEPHRCRDV